MNTENTLYFMYTPWLPPIFVHMHLAYFAKHVVKLDIALQFPTKTMFQNQPLVDIESRVWSQLHFC